MLAEKRNVHVTRHEFKIMQELLKRLKCYEIHVITIYEK